MTAEGLISFKLTDELINSDCCPFGQLKLQ